MKHRAILALVLAASPFGCVDGCRKSESASSAGADAAASPPRLAVAHVEPVRAELPADETTFVDAVEGAAWLAKCRASLGRGELSHAKAECIEGLRLAKGANGVRPDLLFAIGEVEERAGNAEGARGWYAQSYALRPAPEVGAALERVGGSKPASPR